MRVELREYLKRTEIEIALHVQLRGYRENLSIKEIKKILHFSSVDAVKAALHDKHLVFSSVPIKKSEIVRYITEQYLKMND